MIKDWLKDDMTARGLMILCLVFIPFDGSVLPISVGLLTLFPSLVTLILLNLFFSKGHL